MTTFLLGLAAFFAFGIVLVVTRALIGPTVFDRLLATNAVGTLVVLIMVILSLAMDRPGFVDLALLYALINFIGVIATLKYIRFGQLGSSKNHQEENMLDSYVEEFTQNRQSDQKSQSNKPKEGDA